MTPFKRRCICPASPHVRAPHAHTHGCDDNYRDEFKDYVAGERTRLKQLYWSGFWHGD